jgi:hypothetical protein
VDRADGCRGRTTTSTTIEGAPAMLRSFARIRKVTSVVLATAGLAVCAASAQAASQFVTGVGHVNGNPSVTRTMSTPLNPSLRSSLAWRQYLADRRRRDSQPTDTGCQRRQRESSKPDDQEAMFERRFPTPRAATRPFRYPMWCVPQSQAASRPFEVNEPDRFTQGNVGTASAADIRVRAWLAHQVTERVVEEARFAAFR